MLLVLQFPFADVRGFLADSGGRLCRPAWPAPLPGRDFIRSSGLVKRRRRGGAIEWAGEEVYGDASKALRFRSGHEVDIGLRCLFRRYYSEGVVARLEVGLRVSADTRSKKPRVLDILRKAFNTVVTVRSATGNPRISGLLEAGPILANHFLEATTAHRASSESAPQSWWLSCGTPAAFLQHGQDEELLLLRHSRHVLDIGSGGASLRHSWFELSNQRCSTWTLRTDASCIEPLRRLRMHVSRLHAELECLRVVLTHLTGSDRLQLSRNAIGTEALQSYLNKTIRLLRRPKRAGWNQCEIMAAARQAIEARLEGEVTSLSSLRRHISEKVRLHVADANRRAIVADYMRGDSMGTRIQVGNLTFTGNFTAVSATHLSNSFNQAAEAAAIPELRQKLQTLTALVAKLAGALPPEQAEQLTKDLDSLCSEVVSTRPRREWYELSAKGIIEAAKAVADMTAPVAEAVRDVLSVLGNVSG